MFASIRCYRLHEGSMDDLTRRVDEDFAEQIAQQPGFISYEFLDCGDGEVMTISAFRGEDEAEASRDLALRWSEENLADMEFTRTDALHGEILVSRAAQDLLEAGHPAAEHRFASVRRYMLRSGELGELMHIVDETFAEQIQGLDGFIAYHVIDCGKEILSVSLFRDQRTCEESDELSLQFVREELGGFELERTDVIGGEVVVSRAMADVLEPAHA
jgi:hypothetical protein